MAKFDINKKGYDIEQVDNFINKLSLKYEEKLSEQKDRVFSLKNELALMEERLETYKDKDKQNNEAFNSLLMLAKESNKNEKDKNEKSKNDAMLKLLTACSFDKDGNEIPLEDRINKMKDTMSDEQFESFKKDMTSTYEKYKDDKDFKDSLEKAKSNIKPEDYDKMIDEAKKEAKTTLEQIDKEKKEIEEYSKKIQELDDQINGGDEKDKEIIADGNDDVSDSQMYKKEYER